MYQPIETWDPINVVILPAAVLAFVGVSILWIGLSKKDRSNIISGAIALILCVVTVFTLGPDASEKSSQRRDAMESNIMTKYNARFGDPIYLTDVEYEGKVKRSGPNGGGTYFNLTYADGSTDKIRFFFSSTTGEPRCSCDDLKHPGDLEMSAPQ